MNKIRIGSGELRGRSIMSPKSEGTHPMGAREKMALFNMIAGRLPGSLVLDAFAGSGALGIEALSRGAKFVLFVDNDLRVCEVIKSNLMTLGLDGERGKVIKCDAGQVLDKIEGRFDIIIADPPYDNYDEDKIKTLARLVAEPDGIMVLSHPGEAPELPGMRVEKSRQYAGAHISVYAKK